MGNRVDAHVGMRVRMTREFRGLQPADLAQALGISLDRLDRYERGVERIEARHLSTAATRLGVSASFFFAALKGLENSEANDVGHRMGQAGACANDDFDGAHGARVRSRLRIVAGTCTEAWLAPRGGSFEKSAASTAV